MEPRPPNNKRSLNKILSEEWNKSLRRPSPPQSPSRVPNLWSPLSPLPNDPTSPHGDEPQAQAKAAIQALLPAPSVSFPAPVGLGSKPPATAATPAATNISGANESITRPTTSTAGLVHLTDHRVACKVWEGLVSGFQALNINKRLPPPLQSAINTFIPCLDVLEEVARSRHEYEELASDLKCVITLLEQHGQQSSCTRMTDSIANIARSIEQQAKLIESKRCRGKRRRLMEANMDLEELEMYYRRIRSLFRQLQADANLSIWSIVNDHMANTRLERLKPVMLANHDSTLSEGVSRRTCTANTRTAILSGLNDWSNNPDAPDLYWMNGMAGTGKTTIACSFSESLEEHKQLAASFFCTRIVPECREATRIIPTIAYQLARYSVPFQSALCETLGQDPDIGSKNMTKQFERLLKGPLLQVKEAIPNDLVVVIDALDECDDMHEVELLLSILLKSVADIPLKFFVTSRPEPEIYNRMLTRIQGARATLHLHEVEKSLVQADIEVYLAEELEFMSPTPDQIAELARRAGSLFIYAATLVRYIRPGRRSIDHHARLQSALEMATQPSKMHEGVDQLYTAVLRAALDEELLEDREVEDVRLVLWTAVCVQEPVGIDTIVALTRLNDTRVMTALEALRSVIHFSETSGRVSTLHASFPDFMFDKTRSKAFACNLAEYSELLTRRCFEVMEAQLKFNICDLESSFIPDSEVPNLGERVKQAISQPLWYASRYWGDHLQHSARSDLLCTMLSDFLSVRLLFWMEVLNLKRGIRMGLETLLRAKLWLKLLQVGVAPADLVRLAEDARKFVTGFCANPVSRCTPHIYVSSLPFCPKSSTVLARYQKNMRGMITVTGSAMEKREAAPLASWKTESAVFSAAYSPDGSCVAVGCEDGTVSVRNAHYGTTVAGPFEGHSGSVLSVAFSPDSTCIASGSSDKSIRVWSANSGALVAGPFEGHTDLVLSVAYSPDGTRIASGSEDKTIRVWSAYDGALVAGPCKGHTGSVLSVVFSPDGAYIASGSMDLTIRVVNAQNGELVAHPYAGHNNWVRSVAYSPDGTRIVSGSDDKTIRVWNASDGELLVEPFHGHTDAVLSVAYSPDGTCIVSGSKDKTTRVWSAHDGTLIAGPFEGHTGSVWVVAYSPDGTHILSGSYDKTIRVWSAPDDTFLAYPFKAHTHSILSVAYSPDGTCIVSGSRDKTIRVWSTHDNSLVAGPFKAHNNEVLSVAYSPDGTHIASGSMDRTIGVCSAHAGVIVPRLYRGHPDWVRSVAYSPDGAYIASSSSCGTIQVYCAVDGTLVSGPFQGHDGLVFSVAYSPDGTHIVSGASDKTIRVWSAHDGKPVTNPFMGHTDWVRSAVYSPNGACIVSGSDDETVRVWSSHDGTPLVGSFRGHTGPVLSVAYSPDGSCIVSGSKDKTARVWSAHDGSLVAGPFEGHDHWVQSVAYSPNGTYIVTGSEDSTIRVWRLHSDTCKSVTQAHCCPSNPTTTRAPDPCPPTPCVCKLNPALAHLAVRHDGWVVNHYSQLLFWMPSELVDYLLPIHNTFVITPRYSLGIDYDGVLLGEYWHQCYKPE